MYDFLARRAAKKHKTSPSFRTISSWKQQHLALVTSQEGSRSFCYVITPKIAVTRAEKHPGHVHYARRVYARRFSMERENKAELMSRWREEQKKKKKAIKRDLLKCTICYPKACKLYQLYDAQCIMGKN